MQAAGADLCQLLGLPGLTLQRLQRGHTCEISAPSKFQLPLGETDGNRSGDPRPWPDDFCRAATHGPAAKQVHLPCPLRKACPHLRS